MAVNGHKSSALCDVKEFTAENFDYVIVGGGTAGLCVAARLTENPDVKVGVIEAGADNDRAREIRLVLSICPARECSEQELFYAAREAAGWIVGYQLSDVSMVYSYSTMLLAEHTLSGLGTFVAAKKITMDGRR